VNAQVLVEQQVPSKEEVEKLIADKFEEAACDKRDPELVRELLAMGADVHAGDDRALRWACYHGDLDIVKLLLDAGANPNAGRSHGYCLRCCCPGWGSSSLKTSGTKKLTDLLLSAGADPSALSDTELTELNLTRGQYATSAKKLLGKPVHEVKRELLSSPVKKDLDDGLAFAAEDGELHNVKAYLERGADVHWRNDYAVRWAAANDHPEVVRFLVDHGADVNINGGEVVVNAGYSEKDRTLASWLVSKGASLDNIHPRYLERLNLTREQYKAAAKRRLSLCSASSRTGQQAPGRAV